MKKVTVEINGYSASEGTRCFEILDRETIEDIISDLDREKIARRLIGFADEYWVEGTAYIYLDAFTGEIKEGWIQRGVMKHPWSSFSEIVLMTLPTDSVDFWDYVYDDAFFPERSEWEEFQEWREERPNSSAEDFILEKYGAAELKKRKKEIVEGSIDNMEWEDTISEQIEDLYSKVINDED
jgi:hypothetical protein